MYVCIGEKFGTVDRHEMERIFPYSLVHAAYVDMSLGKQRTADEPMGTTAWDDASAREELSSSAGKLLKHSITNLFFSYFIYYLIHQYSFNLIKILSRDRRRNINILEGCYKVLSV